MRSTIWLLLSILTVAGFAVALGSQSAKQQQEPVGYTDTPLIPGSKWRVHDRDRPVPEVVTPGAPSTQSQVGSAPSDAIVLFDGKNLDAWSGGKWKVADGVMTVNGTGEMVSKQTFGDIQLHLEWRAPDEPDRSSQGKGNSGVFFMGKYEMQVLNSYQNRTYADGQAAALYGHMPPQVNAMLPTGQWQSYDVLFTAPRFKEDGTLLSPAYVTAFHNGILVHNHQELLGPSGHKSVPKYKAHGPKLPLKLQDHGNPVSYRNIWIREI
ncbi:MAG: DUF1080 domain-containing protein [Planctomycetes bacterium]|nr:DUF1080 domain-containing protein [Planctomycetota bacterium]